MAEPSLALLLHEVRQFRNDALTALDEVAVVSAKLDRVEATVTSILHELRAIRKQHARTVERVRDIENQLAPTE
jgi:hypothetical protein